MGSLISETPYSEVTATLEVLDRFGVGREDLRKFRAAAPQVQKHIASIFKTTDTMTAISRTSGGVFPVYLEIEVGGKSKDQLLVELQSAGFYASDWAKDIMSKPAWKPGIRETVKFTRVKMSELGFTTNPTTAQIWARIKELGRSLCKPGDGPAIRLVLKDQPRGDYFFCAMEQITDSDGNPDVFRVYRRYDGEVWLSSHWVTPNGEWRLDDEMVFRLGK